MTSRAVLLVGALGSLLTGCTLTSPLDQLAPMPAHTMSAQAEHDADALETRPRLTLTAPVTKTEPDLWQRLRAGFTLTDPTTQQPRIDAQRRWLLQHPRYFDQVFQRGERYLHHIISEAERRDMPLELALLPVVESAFDPFAYSHGQAAGPWQFVPSTGRHFGLEQDWWQDQRRDILLSTDAALTYLSQLARRFDGDWLLALAAYNAGGGTVNRARTRNLQQGRATDFWSLELPRETMAYVPRLLALAQLVRDPDEHQLTLPPLTDQPYFEVVNTGGQIDLSEAAKLAGMSLDELYLLNPAYNRWATAPQGPHRLLVPVAQADALRTGLAALPPEQRLRWQRHTIARGDTLSGIAQQHGTTAAVLREVNKLNGNNIVAGRTLMIPQPAAGQRYTLSAEQRLSRQQDRPRSGRQQQRHAVQPGESLWQIARRYGVQVQELAAWNQMAPADTLRTGQQLVVWTPATQSTSAAPSTIRPVHYAVRRGDSLSTIANRFNVSVSEINRWNRLQGSLLQPGQALTLYVDVRNSR